MKKIFAEINSSGSRGLLHRVLLKAGVFIGALILVIGIFYKMGIIDFPALKEEPDEVTFLVQLDEENEEDNWKQKFIEYLDKYNTESVENGVESWKYKLIYIDDDDIPEIYIESMFANYLNKLVAYIDGEFLEINTDTFSIVERQNRFAIVSQVPEGGYYTKIYQLNKGFELLFNGKITSSRSTVAGTTFYGFYIDDVGVYENVYFQKQNEILNNNETQKVTDLVTYEEILAQLDADTPSSPVQDNTAAELEKLSAEVNSALDSIDSVHISQKTFSDYIAAGQSVKMNASYESDIKDNIAYTGLSADVGGTVTQSEIYVSYDKTTADIYMLSNGSWFKQTDANAARLYKLGSSFEGVEGIRYYWNSTDIYTVDKDSDAENIIVTGIVDSASTRDVLEKFGFLDIIDKLDDSGMFSGSDLQNLLDGISPMEITFYISKADKLPVKMLIDMKKTTESLYLNVDRLFAKYNDHITYTIYSNNVASEFSQYNAVAEIKIPDEAFSATEYMIIK